MSRTIVDRLAVRLRQELEYINGFLLYLFPGSAFVDRDRGGLGYQSSKSVVGADGDILAVFFWGGESQKNTVYIDVTGKGCAQVDFDHNEIITAFDELPDVKVRRIDIAADFYNGEYKKDDIRRFYEQGKFTWRKPPFYGEIVHPHHPEAGDTIYIGKRRQEMFFRFYDKGREQKSKEYPNWTRAELVLKPSNRHIFLMPSAMITERDDIFSGSYKALEEMLPSVSPVRLVRDIQKNDLQKQADHIRKQYSKILNKLLMHYDGDFLKTWDRITMPAAMFKKVHEKAARAEEVRMQARASHKLEGEVLW